MFLVPGISGAKQLLHKKKLTGTLDLPGDMTLLLRCKTGESTRLNLAGISYITLETFHVHETKVHGCTTPFGCGSIF